MMNRGPSRQGRHGLRRWLRGMVHFRRVRRTKPISPRTLALIGSGIGGDHGWQQGPMSVLPSGMPVGACCGLPGLALAALSALS